MANTESLDDGNLITHSSLSIVASRATVKTQDITASGVANLSTISTSVISTGAFDAQDGSALNPAYGFNSEQSLGFYRSANSIKALSYGFLSAPQFISSQTTNQSASSAKVTNQGQIVFSILSLTTNGAAMYYRSGNSVFGWPSSNVVG